MNVDASPGLLCDVPDGGAAPADDCSDHVAGDEYAEREVHAAGRARAAPLLLAAKPLFRWPARHGFLDGPARRTPSLTLLHSSANIRATCEVNFQILINKGFKTYTFLTSFYQYIIIHK